MIGLACLAGALYFASWAVLQWHRAAERDRLSRLVAAIAYKHSRPARGRA